MGIYNCDTDLNCDPKRPLRLV